MPPDTTPQRSRLMKAVRQKDTGPERHVRALMTELGIRYRKNVTGLPGRPDIAHKGQRKAVFVHGCYWHKHSVCGRGKVPKTNTEFWRRKLEENRRRDQRKIDALRARKFDVLVVWECELDDPELLKQRLWRFWQGERPPSSNGCRSAPARAVEASRERFALDRDVGLLVRDIVIEGGELRRSTLPFSSPVTDGDVGASYDLAWLRSADPPECQGGRGRVSIVDLFSGCGGMTAGAVEACRALELKARPVLAVDTDQAARRVYSMNYPQADLSRVDISQVLPGDPGQRTSAEERRLAADVGSPDLVLGGPPCQGHSNLNNHTRRSDPKNLLFLKMARCAEVLSPSHIVVENVNGVLHDSGDVFSRTCEYLSGLGYEVDWGVLKGEELGIPQTRHRVFLVASKRKTPDLRDLTARFRTPPRSVDWAVRDLLFSPGEGTYDQPSMSAPITRQRIDYLFDNDLYDLPNSERPPCHRLKEHSYVSVYGRIRPHEPAPTITTGFTAMGQGRFIHPYRRRTITPHEAARIQFFPDFFRFGDLTRSEYRTLIGNAVPPKFTYLVCLDLLG